MGLMPPNSRPGASIRPVPIAVLTKTARLPMPNSPSCRPIAACRRLFAALLLLACSGLHAQILDRIDVLLGENTAEIVIRFTENIVYQRHAPPGEGKILRVFFRFSDGGVPESELMQQTLRAPKTSRVPTITVTYPELVNGMLISFSQVTRYAVRPGTDSRSIVIEVPLLPGKATPGTPAARKAAEPSAAGALAAPPETAKPPPAPSPETAAPGAGEALPAPAMAAGEVEARAKAYLGEARGALAANDAATAINRLNRVLGLPVNSQTEAAQALIGEAREMNGEILKARAEYDLYVKLFPAGPSLPRVMERLARLPRDEAVARARPRPLPKEAGPAEWSYNGSLSAYYYTGKSQIETLVPPPPGQLTFSQNNLSLVDQHSLITSLNLNARRRDAFTDTRLIVRDTDNQNYLRPDRSYNRLYSAYIDHTDRQVGYSLRLGRQNPTGLGVMERFDGVQGGYNLNAQWRVNAVYGNAIEFGSPFKKSFYGASVDLLPQTGRPGVSVYAIEQTLDGLLNRRALGTELRYFDGHATAYGMLDYDVLYKGINIAMLQGNYLDDGGNNYYLVLDYRRAPSYSLTNAFYAATPGSSLRDLVTMQGLSAVRQQAAAFTAISKLFSAGVTHPLSENWQLGVDYRVSSISATQPVVAVLPLGVIGVCLPPGEIDTVNNTCVYNTAAQPGSGNSHVVTVQAIGSNLFMSNAVGVANLSLIAAPTYSGQSMGLSYVLPLGEQWRVDTNLRYYKQKDNNGDTQDRFSPSLKLSYQWRNSVYLEGEVGYEVSNATGTLQISHSKREYMYVGVRWDFR
jgi:hypothetical protein